MSKAGEPRSPGRAGPHSKQSNHCALISMILVGSSGQLRAAVRACARLAVPLTSKAPVAKNQNTFEKRRREIEKKQRAEDKRKRRQTKKVADAMPAARPLLPPIDDTE
jgi:hypothetical protein